jgi:uncharacterized protein YndB with AHSA1/START domain
MPTVTKPSLTIKRPFRASAEKVFEAWTRPEALKLWFGPSDDLTILLAEVDLRVGGRYRIVAQAQGSGEQHRVGGIYREVTPFSRLVFTWAWESTPERESLVTVDIKPTDTGCLLTLIHEQFFDDVARDRHRQGWSGTMERLERYLSREIGGAA